MRSTLANCVICWGAVLWPVSVLFAQNTDWPAIEVSGSKEGKVVLYHNITPPGAELLVKEFRKSYPDIDVEATRFASASLIERFSTEFAAQRYLADVVVTVPDERIFKGMAAGWMSAWIPPEIQYYPVQGNYENKNMLFNINTAREALIWNKKKVKPADAPKEWVDLFNPRWKGKVGMNPPWRSVGPQGVIAYWEKLGLGDTAVLLKENNVRFFEGSGGVLQAVIRGDVLLAEVSDLPLNVALADGAPIGVIYPASGTILSQGYVFVAGKAPHVNAGKVFANWLLSEQGQIRLQQFAGLPAARPGIPALSHLPANAELSNAVDGLALTPPAKQKEIVDHWRKVFGIQ